MCGRFVSSSPPDELASYFGAQPVGETLVEPAYNVAPTAQVFVVVERQDHRLLDRFRWGLVPFWAKDLKIGNKMINARAETLATKNAYRRSFARRRCLIPADGFYEWMKVPGRDTKQPVFIHPIDGAPLAFAGLWDTWRPPESGDDDGTPADAPAEAVRSCTIITGRPNAEVAKVHDRMPVLLAPSAWDRWLDPTFVDTGALEALLVPAPSELLRIDPVSTAVNNPRNQGPELTVPVQPETDLGLDRVGE